jgi:hypothetical protein
LEPRHGQAADPATPFGKVYQSFLDDLALEGTKPTTSARYRYNIVRFKAARGLRTNTREEESDPFVLKLVAETPV